MVFFLVCHVAFCCYRLWYTKQTEWSLLGVPSDWHLREIWIRSRSSHSLQKVARWANLIVCVVSVGNHSYVRSVPAVVVPVVPPVWPVVPPVWPVVLPAWHLPLWNCGPVLAPLQWVFGRLDCKEGRAITINHPWNLCLCIFGWLLCSFLLNIRIQSDTYYVFLYSHALGCLINVDAKVHRSYSISDGSPLRALLRNKTRD